MTWEELVAIHAAMPEPKPVVRKLYYDEKGDPIVYTCDDLEGNYIEVDPETFMGAPRRVKVINGVLTHLPPKVYITKLQPSDSGTLCHSQDVAIIANNTGTYWKRQTYEN